MRKVNREGIRCIIKMFLQYESQGKCITNKELILSYYSLTVVHQYTQKLHPSKSKCVIPSRQLSFRHRHTHFGTVEQVVPQQPRI